MEGPSRLRVRLNRTSPQVCRLLARKANGRQPMSNADLAAASGLARSTIAKISQLPNWDSCTLDTIARFTQACGVDLLSPCFGAKFLRSRKLDYMTKASPAQKRMYHRILSAFTG